jgi:16S rRNA G966 N2-methylase RsmD
MALFDESVSVRSSLQEERSGTFVDNMSLPVHRWFRYSAGFAAQWVEQVLKEWGTGPEHIVLDPFAGSGTVSLVCDRRALPSVAVEAHPMVGRLLRAKLAWATPIDEFAAFADKLLATAESTKVELAEYPPVVQRSYEASVLTYLNGLRAAWLACDDRSAAAELTWLAITATLRPTSHAGTAQWQYILPNKTKKKVLSPAQAFQQQLAVMKQDMRWMQQEAQRSRATPLMVDAREIASKLPQQVDAVITSPPYANNYDYADALRFEMSFWGEVNGWSDIHEKARRFLIVSSSQHASRDRLALEELLDSPVLIPICDELAAVTRRLSVVREDHGGKKHYHTMVAAYCRDIAIVLQQLRQVCVDGAHMCWVIGDSAPYGVYCPIERWIGELAVAAGFRNFTFEKLRDRNVKWKNRKHRVPLKEGLLWIEG